MFRTDKSFRLKMSWTNNKFKLRHGLLSGPGNKSMGKIFQSFLKQYLLGVVGSWGRASGYVLNFTIPKGFQINIYCQRWVG